MGQCPTQSLCLRRQSSWQRSSGVHWHSPSTPELSPPQVCRLAAPSMQASLATGFQIFHPFRTEEEPQLMRPAPTSALTLLLWLHMSRRGATA